MKKKLLIVVSVVFFLSQARASDSVYIYIADWYNHRIVRMEDMFGTGWTEFGSYGTGTGEFDGPSWILPAVDGKIYITDRGNGRVVRIDNMSGAGWIELPGFEWPRTIEQDNSGRFYIADDHAHNVIRFDDISGAGWTELGSFGSGIGEFNRPTHIMPNSGKMFICDAFNNRIVRCDNMSTAGWLTYGSYGSGIGQFDVVLTVAFDDQGRLYLSDDLNDRIVRIDDMYGHHWIEYGSTGSGVGNFTHPNHIALDDSNRIYVSDSYNHRIVRINDMTGTGWTEFGTFGSGVGEFNGQTHIRIIRRFPENVRDELQVSPLHVSLSASPNPFNSAVRISLDGGSESAKTLSTIEIFDVNGRIVAEITPPTPLDRGEQGKSPLLKGDLGGLFVWRPAPSITSGVYLVRATSGDGESVTKRIVYLK